jgi:nucleotide-binding universal stress UspA family protein
MTGQINKILVACDFSPVALNAVKTAVAICARQSASLTIIHVVDNSVAFLLPEACANGTILPEMVEYAEINLAKLARNIGLSHNLAVATIVVTGNPADQILLYSDRKDIDLIIIGAHGSSGIRERVIGSNAHRLIKNSTCPVVMVPGTTPCLDFKKILFPVRAHVRPTKKYRLLRPIITANRASVLVVGAARRNLTANIAEVHTQVTTISKMMTEDRVDHRSDLHTCDNVAQQILDISNLESPDLIAITSSSNRSFRNHFLSAYVRDIINHSKFPVLSVRDFDDCRTDRRF